MFLFLNGALILGLFLKQVMSVDEFSCDGRPAGYYADIASDCQKYHVCNGGRRHFTYSCPNTTRFQQRMMICDHWYLVDCGRSEQDFGANLLIGQRGVPFVRSEELLRNKPVPQGFKVPLDFRNIASNRLKNGTAVSKNFNSNSTQIPFTFTTSKATTKYTTGKTLLFNRLGGPLPRPFAASTGKPINYPSPAAKTTSNSFTHNSNQSSASNAKLTASSFGTSYASVSPNQATASSIISGKFFGTTAKPQTYPTPVLQTTSRFNPTYQTSPNQYQDQSLFVQRTTVTTSNYLDIERTENPVLSVDDNSLEGRSLWNPAPYKLEWTLPDIRAMLFVPDNPEDVVAPNIKKFSVTIPQRNMNFRDGRGENPVGPCPGHCNPIFIQPGTCLPCVMIK